MKELKLEDLTKEELIGLIKRHFYLPSQKEMVAARRDALGEKARLLMEEAIRDQNAAMKLTDPIENRDAFIAASEKFNKAQAMYDRHSAMFDFVKK